MHFVLYLYIEIGNQTCLQGVRFTYIITELSDELQQWLSIRKEYIWNLDISVYLLILLFPSVEFNLFTSYQNCWPNETVLFSNTYTDKKVKNVFH